LTALTVTAFVGADDATSALSNVTIDLPPTSTIGSGVIGVYCDRGNAPTPDHALPSPNTILDGVTIDALYEVGVAVSGTDASGTDAPASGCNLQIVRSTLRRMSQGVW